MNLYARQHSGNDTYIPHTEARTVNCDIDSKQKQLGMLRLTQSCDALRSLPWSLYKFDGQSYSLRGEL